MKQLESMLDTAAATVTGRTVAENLADVKVADPEVIRPLQRPFAGKPGIVILRGNLAPEGAIVKIGLRGEGRPLKFRGKANVFENSPDAEAALKAGKIKKGDAVVLRGQGVCGGPGMGGASRLVFQIDGAGLGPDVAVVTDGQLSGLVNKGLVLGEVAPEVGDRRAAWPRAKRRRHFDRRREEVSDAGRARNRTRRPALAVPGAAAEGR